MSRATVELDFFGMEKESSGKTQFQKLFHRQRSFRGSQSAISKINPEVLKTVIASGSAAHISHGKWSRDSNILASRKAFSVPSTPKGDQFSFQSSPVYNHLSRHPTPESAAEAAPLTIFYNGTVSVFDLPLDKAESIFKLAAEGNSKPLVKSGNPKTTLVASADQQQLLDSLDGDLPIARRKSLQRFLAKRQERLVSVAPYACHTEYAFLEQKPAKDLL